MGNIYVGSDPATRAKVGKFKIHQVGTTGTVYVGTTAVGTFTLDPQGDVFVSGIDVGDYYAVGKQWYRVKDQLERGLPAKSVGGIDPFLAGKYRIGHVRAGVIYPLYDELKESLKKSANP